jgi:hypothetical protein
MRRVEQQRKYLEKDIHYITAHIFGFRIRCSSVDIVTRLRAGRFEFRISAGEGDPSVLQVVQTGSGTYPASYSMGTGVPPQEVKRSRIVC